MKTSYVCDDLLSISHISPEIKSNQIKIYLLLDSIQWYFFI